MGTVSTTFSVENVALVTVTALTAACTWAAPVVIYGSGDIGTLAPYYETLTSPAKNQGTQLDASRSVDVGRFDVNRYLPVRTPQMSPGKVARRALDHAPTAPIIIIGSDAISKHWLAKHRERLMELGAVGLLVQAERIEDLETIARLGRDLKITPGRRRSRRRARSARSARP